ncbi:hypothetical protein VSR34_17950 [Paraburkholderia sp. JHI2823]|uniref:hypothetical protein n=1 Tax=Paraburkholderia sp. JHI2823 TaxID=3112960 RepID=UPI003179A099
MAAASRLAATGDGAPDERAGGVADNVLTNPGGPPGNAGGKRVYDGDYPSIDEETITRRPRRPLYAWVGLGALAIALTAYAVLRSDWEPKLGAQVVEGSVTGSKDKLALPAARPHGAHVMAALPRAATTRANMAQPGVALQKAPAFKLAPAAPSYANAHSDAARNLASARASLDRNNLWPARRAITSALDAEPGNTDAQQIEADLVAREQERDMLIGLARQCEHLRQWACVRQDAGHAVNVDTSSREARRLLTLADAGHESGGGKRHGRYWPRESQYAQAGDTHSHQGPLFWHH